MPQLDFSTYFSQIFWLAVSFVLFFAVVRLLLTPKMNAIFARRDDELEKNLKKAEELRAKAEALQKRYRNALQETRSRARQLVMSELAAAEAAAAEKMAKLNAELQTKLEKGERELRKLVAKTLKETADSKLAETLAAKAVAKTLKTASRAQGPRSS